MNVSANVDSPSLMAFGWRTLVPACLGALGFLSPRFGSAANAWFPMPVVSQAHRFIYFAAPATGSTAVRKVLVRRGIGDDLLAKNIVADGKVIVRAEHSTYVEAYRAGLVTERMERYLRICNVRNIYSLYVAKYLRYRTKRREQASNPNSWINKLPEKDRSKTLENIERSLSGTFEEFLIDFLGDRPPFDPHRAYHRPCHVFLHQENLKDDFGWFVRRKPLPLEDELEQRNVTGAMPEGKTYHDYYTDMLRERVRVQNAPFFERFPEYDFDGIDKATAASRRPNLKGLQASLKDWRNDPED